MVSCIAHRHVFLCWHIGWCGHVASTIRANACNCGGLPALHATARLAEFRTLATTADVFTFSGRTNVGKTRRRRNVCVCVCA